MVQDFSSIGLSHTLRGEWVKLTTWPNGRRTIWFSLLSAMVGAALLLLSVPVTRSTTLPEMTSQQHLEIMLMGVDVANITMIVLAVLFVAEENRTQMVEVTAALMPRRSTVVVAKTLLMAIVASVIAVAASLLVVITGMVILGVSGAMMPPLGEGWALRMIFGCMLMPPVHAVISVCFAYLMRSALLSFLAVFVVMSLPSLATVLPETMGRAAQFLLVTPAIHTIAGISRPGAIDYTSLPSAFLILAAWVGLVLPAAILAFTRRDI